MHGARGGAKTEEGIKKCKLSSLKHGFYTEFEQMELRQMREELKESRQLESYIEKKIGL